jgi:4Fe-4S iron-sulfur cluster binding domain/DR2241 stabilising domain
MPTEKPTPDIEALAAAIEKELLFGQVLIRRNVDGFELRHVLDADVEVAKLRTLDGQGMRPLAQFTLTGAFRPLKSAPTLQTGWRINVAGLGVLRAVLDQLYPGAVADWFAARADNPPLTSYRQFTARQTGMYRITTHLDDAMAGAVIRACCHVDFCLKRRLWSVEGLPPDEASAKSCIPCLEPCAILLEFARKMVRLQQQDGRPGEADNTLPIAECDFDAPNNPRRLRFFLETQTLAVKSQPS